MNQQDRQLLQQALDYLERHAVIDGVPLRDALRERLNESVAQPEQHQDSTCNNTLRAQGKAYPRTCKKCGLGPRIGEPIKPAPVPEAHKQEPVAKVCHAFVNRIVWNPYLAEIPPEGTPLYTRPQASEPLTDEEKHILAARYDVGVDVISAIAAHSIKEKNT